MLHMNWQYIEEILILTVAHTHQQCKMCACVWADAPFLFFFSNLPLHHISFLIPGAFTSRWHCKDVLLPVLHLVFGSSLLQQRLKVWSRWRAPAQAAQVGRWFGANWFYWIIFPSVDLASGRFRFRRHLALNLRLSSPTLQPPRWRPCAQYDRLPSAVWRLRSCFFFFSSCRRPTTPR